ncbi:hypothetical protein [Streptomyces sp. NPDC053542]|uniref:hypothetical protein n=1 Tax=Streptomyces sp. NPDC053542 TaxID=3365710 RepID=UPI0037D801A4
MTHPAKDPANHAPRQPVLVAYDALRTAVTGLFASYGIPRRRADGDFTGAARALFGTLLACPPVQENRPVRSPGWWEAERAETRRREGIPLPAHLHEELTALGVLSPAKGAAR